MMRIITGSARGTHLQTLTGDATRPTSERAKEALFSMLSDRAAARLVLDLFAGSGQLGLEALSRGAARCVFVDASRDAASVVRANAKKTHLEDRAEIVVSDALSYLGRTNARFDLVFLDPPYAAGLLPAVLRTLHGQRLLLPAATVVVECADPAPLEADAALGDLFEIEKKSRYGVAHILILKEKQA